MGVSTDGKYVLQSKQAQNNTGMNNLIDVHDFQINISIPILWVWKKGFVFTVFIVVVNRWQ